jgi:hypothetical protein
MKINKSNGEYQQHFCLKKVDEKKCIIIYFVKKTNI